MKGLLACLAIIAVANVVEGSLKPGLKVKFDMGTDPSAGTDYFFSVPLNTADAKADGWRQTRRPPGPLPELVMFCSPNKNLCGLYDDTENVAGLQISVSKNGFTNNVFEWEKRGFRKWHTAIDGKCTTQYVTEQFFVSAEYLQLSKEERLAARDPTRLLQENAIWLTGIDGELLKVSSSEEDIIQQNLFTEQACLPWMGKHYYYNMTSSTPCDAENMYPWFPMTMDGELISSGFITFGNLPISEQRDWFERPDEATVRMIVPNGPECLYGLSSNPGVLTMHIYYTDTPWLIAC